MSAAHLNLVVALVGNLHYDKAAVLIVVAFEMLVEIGLAERVQQTYVLYDTEMKDVLLTRQIYCD